jgi:hypothetical protein
MNRSDDRQPCRGPVMMGEGVPGAGSRHVTADDLD